MMHRSVSSAEYAILGNLRRTKAAFFDPADALAAWNMSMLNVLKSGGGLGRQNQTSNAHNAVTTTNVLGRRHVDG